MAPGRVPARSSTAPTTSLASTATTTSMRRSARLLARKLPRTSRPEKATPRRRAAVAHLFPAPYQPESGRRHINGRPRLGTGPAAGFRLWTCRRRGDRRTGVPCYLIFRTTSLPRVCWTRYPQALPISKWPVEHPGRPRRAAGPHHIGRPRRWAKRRPGPISGPAATAPRRSPARGHPSRPSARDRPCLGSMAAWRGHRRRPRLDCRPWRKPTR